MNELERLRAEITTEIRGELRKQQPFAQFVVSAVQDDGSVNLDDGTGGLLIGVPCMEAYNPRQAGDVVLVAKWGGVLGQVLGKVGQASTVTAVPGMNVTYGTQAPPADAVSGTAYITNAGSIYVQTTAEPDVTPGQATVPTTDVGSWINSSRDGSKQYPIQGNYSYPSGYAGAWFYGTHLADVLAVGTVKSIAIKIARNKDTSYGNPHAAIPIHLYTHPHLTAPNGQLTRQGDPFTASNAWLQVGEGEWVTLRDDMVAALVAGTAKGLACYAPTGMSDYVHLTGGCGSLEISYQ